MKETCGSIRKVLCWCKRPGGDILNFCVGVRDLGRYSKFMCGCKNRGAIPNFCVGVRDPWRNPEFLCGGVRDLGRYPKFLCGCKRPGELSQISVWV